MTGTVPRSRSVCGITFWMLPSIIAFRTSIPCSSCVNLDPGLSIVARKCWQSGSVACSARSVSRLIGATSVSVRFLYSLLGSHISTSSSPRTAGSACSVRLSTLSFDTANTGTSSSRGVVSSPSVSSLDIASGAICILPGRCTTSNSNSCSRSRQRASLPVASVMFMIHFSASWSVRNVNLVPSRYGLRSMTGHTIARHFLCVVS